MKRLIFTLLISGVAFGFANAKLPRKTITIKPAASPITLDGAADELAWTSLDFIDAKETPGRQLAAKNNTVKFKITYDDKNVYVFIDVKDSKLDTSQSKVGETWLKDCNEVFFQLDTAQKGSNMTGKNGHVQLRKVFGREQVNSNPGASGWDAIKHGMEVVEYQPEVGTFDQEWKAPWDSLAASLVPTTLWDKVHFKFEIQNADNDGSGRNSQIFWNDTTDNGYNYDTDFGMVVTQWKVGVKEIAAANNEISFSNNLIKANSLTTIKVYNTAGMLIKVANNVNQLSVADLKSGIYAATANNKTIKFFKK